MRYLAVGSVLAAVTTLALLVQTPAHANNIQVGQATVIASDGTCSLMEAVENANNNAQTHPNCAGGGVADVLSLSDSFVYPNYYILINSDMTIQGHNASVPRLVVMAGATVTVNDVILTGLAAQTSENGGAIWNGGTLTLNNVAVTDNHLRRADGTFTECIQFGAGDPGKPGGNGGGIYTEGDLTLNDSRVENNEAGQGGQGGGCAGGQAGNGGKGGSGGGIAAVAPATLSINRSTIAGNQTGLGGPPGEGYFGGSPGESGVGGGIALLGAPLHMNASTVSGNSTLSAGGSQTLSVGGGGIYHQGGPVEVSTITNSTVAGNSSPNAWSGGIYNYTYLRIVSSTIALNTGAGGNVGIFNSGIIYTSNSIVAGPGNACQGGGSYFDEGYNMDDATQCGFTALTSIQNQNPPGFAAGLADNGGPTRTIAIAPDNSLADDWIPGGTSGCGTTISTDQRGAPRPQGNGKCDIGAFEVGVLPTPSPTPSPTPTTTPVGQTPTSTPTATPVGQTPTPTPTATPVGQTPTPTPTDTPAGQTPSPTPTATPVGQTPTPTAAPGEGLMGDTDCDDEVDSVDSLFLLREVAGFAPAACSDRGDVDCDDERDSVDALFILRFVAELAVNQPPDCRAIGT